MNFYKLNYIIYSPQKMGYSVMVNTIGFGPIILGSNPPLSTYFNSGIAQLVRVSGCHPGGRGFESRYHCKY